MTPSEWRAEREAMVIAAFLLGSSLVVGFACGWALRGWLEVAS